MCERRLLDADGTSPSARATARRGAIPRSAPGRHRRVRCASSDKGAAHYRKVAAELVQRFPEIVEPLRDGRLCVTSVVELAKVLTPENREDVLPRFFHRSKREAMAVAAEIRPAEAVPRRTVVTPARAEALLSAANRVSDRSSGSGRERRDANRARYATPQCGFRGSAKSAPIFASSATWIRSACRSNRPRHLSEQK
jgi:hypothetical protein